MSLPGEQVGVRDIGGGATGLLAARRGQIASILSNCQVTKYLLMTIGSKLRPRWLPEKSFPSYAYLPGRQPHPVRHPAGHSYHSETIPVAEEASLDSDMFVWGIDLFNHGYYWEAHEAWEGLWQVADRGAPLRTLFKGLILLSAAGVKIREGKQAAVRHAGRAAALLRRLMNAPDRTIERALGMSPAVLAEHAEAAARIPAALQTPPPRQPQAVFDFILGSNSPANAKPIAGGYW